MYQLRVLLRQMSRGVGAASDPAVQSYVSKLGLEHAFNLRRAVVLSKLSRFEYLKRQHRDLTEQQLETYLRDRGTDYDVLITHHKLHKEFEEHVRKTLIKQGVETQVVDRFNYTADQVSWADIVFAAGGDGTFLLAASRVPNNLTPVVGLNSDPSRSEGRLCLSTKCTDNFQEMLKRLKRGQFKWKFRSRIRITMKGKDIFQSPTELHEPELLEPHHSGRYHWHKAYHWHNITQLALFVSGVNKHLTVIEEKNPLASSVKKDVKFFDCMTELQKLRASQSRENTVVPQHQLPILALNEVFIGEKLSARVSYFEMRVNDDPAAWRVKSSGLCISTGTGSTSWHLSMNRLTEQSVNEVIRILSEEGLIRPVDPGLASRVAQQYNDGLAFMSDDLDMSYTIRDLISAEVWPSPKGIPPRGHVQRLEVCSRCFDAGLVVDGTVFFNFNDGTSVVLEVCPEDSLRTVLLQ